METEQLRGWEEACRICGCRTGPVIDVFGDEGRRKQLLVKIRYCFSKQVLNVNNHDGLPKVICLQCQKALVNSHMNARKIHHVQVYLKEKISKSKSASQTSTQPNPATASTNSCSSSEDSDSWEDEQAPTTALNERKDEEPNLESVLQDLFAASEEKKPEVDNGNLLTTPDTDTAPAFPPPTSNQQDFKLPELFFNEDFSMPTQETISSKPSNIFVPLSSAVAGRKNAELLNPTINTTVPRPSLLSLPAVSLPKIVLPKEPTKDLPAQMDVAPKILWNDDLLSPSTSTPTTTTSLKDFRMNRTPPQQSLIEADDPSKPVSLISHGSGQFKCSRCSVLFKDIAIPSMSPGDTLPSNNNSVVVNHCLNVHGTKAMLFRCPVCQHSFPTTSQVEEHLRLHSPSSSAPPEVEKVQCTTCNKELPNRASLKVHMQVSYLFLRIILFALV